MQYVNLFSSKFTANIWFCHQASGMGTILRSTSANGASSRAPKTSSQDEQEKTLRRKVKNSLGLRGIGKDKINKNTNTITDF